VGARPGNRRSSHRLWRGASRVCLLCVVGVVGWLFGRCLRLSWWSTTILIAVGVVWMLASRAGGWSPLARGGQVHQLAIGSAGAIWWLMVLLRSGCRYSGPADGPGWQPRRPRCEGCGYPIVGLPTSSNCPECGRAVAESLSGMRSGRCGTRGTRTGDRGVRGWATERCGREPGLVRRTFVTRPYTGWDPMPHQETGPLGTMRRKRCCRLASVTAPGWPGPRCSCPRRGG